MAYRELECQILRDSHLIGRLFEYRDGLMVLRLPYEGADELFDTHAEGGRLPLLNPQLYDTLDSAFLAMPHGHELRLEIELDDYPKDRLSEALEVNFRQHILTLLLRDRRQNKVCLALLLLGSAMLMMSYWLGRVFDIDLVFDVVNITGSLLIWSGGERFFLDKSHDRFLRHRYEQMLVEGRYQ